MPASTDQPMSLEKRTFEKELWKIAAAIAIFALVGAVLVLLLRNNDDEPTVAAPVSTATTFASPAAEATATSDVNATQQAAQGKLTATAVVHAVQRDCNGSTVRHRTSGTPVAGGDRRDDRRRDRATSDGG